MDATFIMNQWRESLKFFSKPERRLYLLGTLNTLLRAIKKIAGSFWWLFIIWGVVVNHFLLDTSIQEDSLSQYAFMLSNIVMRSLVAYVVILTMRPSLEPKNRHYYIKYLPKLWAIALIATFAEIVVYLPLYPLILLFFCDDTNDIFAFGRACKRAGRAILYFLPVFSVLGSLLFLCNSILVTSCMSLLSCELSTLWLYAGTFGMQTLALLLLLIHFAMVTVYYIVLKHTNFDLLFT